MLKKQADRIKHARSYPQRGTGRRAPPAVRRTDALRRRPIRPCIGAPAGSLVHVGEGKWSAGDLAAALVARDRAACGQVAPPHGLYLARVEY